MRWEELSTNEMKQLAVDSGGVCVLPIGCVEKHGDHLPTGTDMYICRAIAEQAAQTEKVLIFPYYFMGQTSECKHYVGCVGASHEVISAALLAMCDEIARNGFKKIVIFNSHGGNIRFLETFAMKLCDLGRDYVVYISGMWSYTQEDLQKIYEAAGTTELGDHGGLSETAIMLYVRPDLVHMDRQDGAEGYRQNQVPALKKHGVFTGLTWYADFPDHFAGDHSAATAELGKVIVDVTSDMLCEIIRNVKADDVTPALFKQYNVDVRNPL